MKRLGVSISYDSMFALARSHFSCKVGDEKRVIKGLDEGIRGMKAGGTRRIVVPPQVTVAFHVFGMSLFCFFFSDFGLVWIGLVQSSTGSFLFACIETTGLSFAPCPPLVSIAGGGII